MAKQSKPHSATNGELVDQLERSVRAMKGNDYNLAAVIQYLDHELTLETLETLSKGDLFHFRELLRHWMELADARL